MELLESSYRLLDVTDKTGHSRVAEGTRYQRYAGCVGVNMHLLEVWPGQDDIQVLGLEFVRDEKNRPISRRLRTSPVEKTEKRKGRLLVTTCNSIYHLEPAVCPPLECTAPKGIIELYLHNKGNFFFAGFGWNATGNPCPIRYYLHSGMFQDSCLLILEGSSQCVCSYFPLANGVELYGGSAPGHQFSEAQRFLVHNVSDDPLWLRTDAEAPKLVIMPHSKIQFERYPR